MTHLPRALWLAAGLAGCGYASKGIHPGPKGVAVVLLEADGAGRAVPIACYDPLWVEFRGPRDCADLVPPGAWVRSAAGAAVLVDRGPAPCGVAFTVQGPAVGLLLWSEDARPGPVGDRVDLDRDGRPEQLSRRDGRWTLTGPRGTVRGCPR